MKNFIHSNFLPVAVLIVSGFAVYAGSLGHSFVWDDEILVVENPSIRSPAAIPGLFTTGLFQGIRGNFYRPLQALSYAVDYQCWGLSPFGYHLTNLLLHIGNTVLVFFILGIMTRRRLLSFLAALIFLVHPVQTEAVAYIAGRADLLAAFFIFLSLFFFLTGKKFFPPVQSVVSRRSISLLLSIIFFLFALLAKEATLILPLLILLCGFVSRKREERSGKVPSSASGWYYAALVLIALLYLGARYAVFRSGVTPLSSNPYSFYKRFLTSWKVLLQYMEVVLFPIHLRMERVIPMVSSVTAPAVLTAGIVFSTITVAVLRAYRRSLSIFFGITWFFLALVPYMNWFPLNAEMAEHWLYLPLAGFALIPAAVPDAYRGRRPRRVAVVCTVMLICSLIALTVRRNLDWRDNATIYRATARLSPGSPRARYNLGNIYLAEGRPEAAANEYRASLLLKPGDARCRRNLGNALLRLNRLPEAIREYEAAVLLQPDNQSGLSTLGAAYGMAGRLEEAIRVLEGAIELDPDQPEPYNNLGSIFTRLERFEDAGRAYRRALELQPGMVEAVFNLGVVYYYQDRLSAAREQMDQTLRLSPGFTRARHWREKIEKAGRADQPGP